MSRWPRKTIEAQVTDNSEMMDIEGMSLAEADAILANVKVGTTGEVAMA